MTAPGGGSPPSGPQWSLEDEQAYQRALDLLTAVTATYSALLDRADEAGDEQLERRLLGESLQVEDVRRDLTPFNRAEIDRVLAEYPAVLKRLEAQA